MGYGLVLTPEVREWLHDLRRRDRPSAVLVAKPSPCCSRPRPSWAAPSPTGSATPGSPT